MEKVATRGQILWLKCTKFDFGWGSTSDPAVGAHSAPPDPLAGFKGPTSKGEEGRGREGGRKGGKMNPPFKMSTYGPGLRVTAAADDDRFSTEQRQQLQSGLQ